MIKNIRPATFDELPQIMNILKAAKEIMIRSGNPTQWTDGYPSSDLMKAEITAGHCYVLYNNTDRIVATFCFIPGPEPTYNYIEGKWTDEKPYYVIHRLASDGTEPHVAARCFDWCFRQHPKLRIDTHQNNKMMQHLLDKYGFTKCGTIYLHNGEPRIAYIK